MINGYEEIYGTFHADKKKYDVLDNEQLAHDLGNCLTKTPLGISTTEAYVSIVEQHIGKCLYSALRHVYSNYDSLVYWIVDYQEKVAKYNQINSEKNDINNKINDKIAKIRDYEAKMEQLLENGEEQTARMDIRAENEKFHTEIHKETESINELMSEQFNKAETLAILKPQIRALKNSIMQMYEALVVSMNNLKDVKLDGFKKFDNAEFEQEVKQDFVDSSLLPGEEKKEDLYRKMADAKFQMMKMESIYLMDSVDAAKELIKELKKNQLKSNLPQEIVDRHSTHKGMNYASTVMLEEYDFAFSQEAFNDYYLYMADLFKNMNYGANWVEGAEKYYKTGIDMGIPQYKHSQIKHMIGEMTGKIKVNYGYNMVTISPLVDSFDKMKGGVKFDFNKQYEQGTELNK